MWHPENPTRHTLPATHWPSADAAANSLLFQPLNVGSLTLANRTWVPAMVPWRATDDGFVTQDNIDWYARFAAGRPGVIVVEATGIRDVPSGPLLRIGHDRFIEGLRRMVEAVRQASGGETRFFIQIIDFLSVKRRPEAAKFFQRFLDITPRHREMLAETLNEARWLDAAESEIRAALAELPENLLEKVLRGRELSDLRNGYRERVTDTELAHVRNLPEVLPQLFADAAARAREAGFDGVELHYAHAYTMASFLSARNTRTDGYGGARENRVRLPLEVYAAVRARAGADYCVGARFLSDEVIAGGNRVDDASYFAAEFARAGMDFLSISKGGKFEDAKQPKVGAAVYPYTGPSGYECMPSVLSDARGPFARNLPLVAQIRQAVRQEGFTTPIVGAGGIHNFEQAESALQRGDADIIALARQALADPDWFAKVKTGHGDAVRVCTYTNYCEGLDQVHKQVTCKLWDRKGLDEPDVKLSHDGKRRLLPPNWRPE